MNSNFSQPQNQNNSQAQPRRRTGLLSGGYADQQSAAPSGQPASPQGFHQPPGAVLPGPAGPPGQFSPPQQQRQAPIFMARPVQMVQRWSQKMVATPMMQRWSQKMAAMRQPALPVDPNPLVRYHPPQQPVPTHERSDPWRLSRTYKITRMIRKRRERMTPANKRIGVIVSSIIIALLVILVSSGTISSYAYYQNQLPQLQNLANMQLEQSTRFYDRNGKLIYTLYDTHIGRSTPVSYQTIPGYLQDAQIAAEDKSFWTNNGVDATAIVRSAFIDANAGQAQTGASTLTQQVVKNLINNEPANKASLEQGQPPDRSIQRKVSEAALAIGLTQQYPKWKILEMYFNISGYGAQEQGVEAAAQDFFGLKPKCDVHFKCLPAITFLNRDLTKCKDPGDQSTCQVDPLLGLARASLLASIPQNPVIFDPTVFPQYYDKLLARQDYTLHQMASMQPSDQQHSGPPRINLGLGSQIKYAQANNQDIIINDETINQAEALSKNFKFVGFQDYNQAPHFIQWVIQTLANALGNYQNINPDNGISSTGYLLLLTGGFNVRTTLDLNLETYVEKAINRHINQPEYQKFKGYTVVLSKHNNLHDSAVVVMNAKTGEVLALDGSANYNNTKIQGNVNMALSPRPPGSTMKPIVMAAAFQAGWYPGIVLPDFKTYFPKERTNLPVTSSAAPIYTPPDYGGKWNNLHSNIALAIANSFNIPAIKALYYAGFDNVINTAERLGIDPDTFNQDRNALYPKNHNTSYWTAFGPTLALGTAPVPLLQMVGAYQTFANYGTHIPPQGILDVWDNYGHDLYHYDPRHPHGTRVLSPQISFLVTSILDNEPLRALEFGGDHDLSMFDWTLPDGTHPDVAAKTGTTDGFKDNWTIGYTPDVVVGVWSGNANNSEMIDSIGVTGAAPIWHSVIEYISGKCNTALDQIPCPPLDLHFTNRHFTMPAHIIQASVNKVNGLQGTGYITYMIEGEQPLKSGLPAPCINTGRGKGKKGGTNSCG